MDKCILCNSREGNILLYGKLLKGYGIAVHSYCLYLSSGLAQNCNSNTKFLGFKTMDIVKEKCRAKELYCYYCKKPYATIGCCATRCYHSFHLGCGIKHGAINQYTGTYRSFCHKHTPKSLTRNRYPGVDANCSICFENVRNGQFSNRATMIEAPCCHNGWFHKQCLQQYANSAGYFFKCPLCNNQTKFHDVKLCGIFVPECDAAWELEPNAYHELLERETECTATVCKNSNGRNDDAHDLIYCKFCGTKPQHKCCYMAGKEELKINGDVDDDDDNLCCADCLIIMNTAKAEAAKTAEVAITAEVAAAPTTTNLQNNDQTNNENNNYSVIIDISSDEDILDHEELLLPTRYGTHKRIGKSKFELNCSREQQESLYQLLTTKKNKNLNTEQESCTVTTEPSTSKGLRDQIQVPLKTPVRRQPFKEHTTNNMLYHDTMEATTSGRKAQSTNKSVSAANNNNNNDHNENVEPLNTSNIASRLLKRRKSTILPKDDANNNTRKCDTADHEPIIIPDSDEDVFDNPALLYQKKIAKRTEIEENNAAYILQSNNNNSIEDKSNKSESIATRVRQRRSSTVSEDSMAKQTSTKNKLRRRNNILNHDTTDDDDTDDEINIFSKRTEVKSTKAKRSSPTVAANRINKRRITIVEQLPKETEPFKEASKNTKTEPLTKNNESNDLDASTIATRLLKRRKTIDATNVSEWVTRRSSTSTTTTTTTTTAAAATTRKSTNHQSSKIETEKFIDAAPTIGARVTRRRKTICAATTTTTTNGNYVVETASNKNNRNYSTDDNEEVSLPVANYKKNDQYLSSSSSNLKESRLPRYTKRRTKKTIDHRRKTICTTTTTTSNENDTTDDNEEASSPVANYKKNYKKLSSSAASTTSSYKESRLPHYSKRRTKKKMK